MKGILATICTFALIGSVIPTFPNDLYYHHHPNLAVADTGRRGHTSNKYAHNNHGHSSGRKGYRHGPPSHHRNAYHDSSRNPYLNHKRSYDDNQDDNGLVYTQNGAIDWSKTKVSKVAATSDEDQQSDNYYGNQHQGGRNYATSPNDGYEDNQRSPFRSYNDYEQQQSPRQFYNGGDNYDDSGRRGGSHRNSHNRNNYNSGSYYDDNDDYYDNRKSRYSRNDDYDNDEGYYSNNKYVNERFEENYDYDSNQNENDNGYGGGNEAESNNNNAYGKTKNAYTSPSRGNTNYVGGIRLAGTLPDDGYNHGEGTFYDLQTHITTCGKQVQNTEFVAALNSEQMGDSSSKNEHCGKEVEVIGPSGKSIQVTIVDNCKTCKSGGLDLSPAAFEEIGDFSQGSVPIKWKFV